jgi:hypothetical protein
VETLKPWHLALCLLAVLIVVVVAVMAIRRK